MYISGARQQRNAEELATAAMQIACRAAKLYLENHNLQAIDEALASCVCSHVRAMMREALAASKKAMSAGLSQWVDTAFGTVMLQAGIEAAKEAAFPKS
jgi:tRNA A37 N6-isopentenylltransferase MiaA